ncbi:hypothetical protein [Paracoccus benzoatiresistens]|uniref:Uncharacterized protein n=1 Tax=Paracoccus benzoatiresistens TaxID=2997341 RepID=A0ABT4J7J6_9RHOB|nr:hypothetical protein [Paracoccus sp. EF6]MCZ0963100.1 hypothetical protein [Paracoccus sp. EF6]
MEWTKADDVIRKVFRSLRQAETLGVKNDRDGILFELRFALRMCNAPSAGELVPALEK